MRFFHNSLRAAGNRPIIIWAASQGTGTVLNYMCTQRSQLVPDARIKLVILEGVVASANQAILYTLTNGVSPEEEQILLAAQGQAFDIHPHPEHLPFGRRVVRWFMRRRRLSRFIPGISLIAPRVAAKYAFPSYEAHGVQPIKSLEYFPERTSVLLVHSAGDQVLPCSGAKAIFYGLKNAGHVNTFILEREGQRHIQLFGPEERGFPLAAFVARVMQSYEGTNEVFLSNWVDGTDSVEIIAPDHIQFGSAYRSIMRSEHYQTHCVKYTFLVLLSGLLLLIVFTAALLYTL